MGTVIKAGHSGTLLHRPFTVDLVDHMLEAEAAAAEKHRRADRVLEEARRAAERLKAEARAAGRQAGYAEGLAAGRADGFRTAHDEAETRFSERHASVVSALNDAIAGVNALKADLELRARRDLLELAAACAMKLTFKIGALHREAARANLERAIRTVGARTDLRILAHPDDVESLREFAPALLADLAAPARVQVEAEASMAPGGCRVITCDAEVDAALETQVRQLTDVLLGAEAMDDQP